jgi:hypothetical protein
MRLEPEEEPGHLPPKRPVSRAHPRRLVDLFGEVHYPRLKHYTAQAAVNARGRVVVACGVTQSAADGRQFVPILDQVAHHLGERPAVVTADAGYFSEANVTASQAGARHRE